MSDAELFPITQAAAELYSVAQALRARDAAWFAGNAGLADYYQQLSQQLQAFLDAHRKES